MKLSDLPQALLELERTARLRVPDDQVERARLVERFGSRFIDAASNDYLGLALGGERNESAENVPRETELWEQDSFADSNPAGRAPAPGILAPSSPPADPHGFTEAVPRGAREEEPRSTPSFLSASVPTVSPPSVSRGTLSGIAHPGEAEAPDQKFKHAGEEGCRAPDAPASSGDLSRPVGVASLERGAPTAAGSAGERTIPGAGRSSDGSALNRNAEAHGESHASGGTDRPGEFLGADAWSSPDGRSSFQAGRSGASATSVDVSRLAPVLVSEATHPSSPPALPPVDGSGASAASAEARLPAAAAPPDEASLSSAAPPALASSGEPSGDPAARRSNSEGALPLPSSALRASSVVEAVTASGSLKLSTLARDCVNEEEPALAVSRATKVQGMNDQAGPLPSSGSEGIEQASALHRSSSAGSPSAASDGVGSLPPSPPPLPAAGLVPSPAFGRSATFASVPALGAGSSRLIFGTSPEHVLLEEELAAWVRLPASLLFASGYAANVGALGAVLSPEDAVFSDALNHASLIDGIRLSRARALVVPHLNLAELEKGLRQSAAAPARWVVCEAYYSMDGDGPDLAALRELCDRYDAQLYVDEAHSLGTFGTHGAGLCAAQGIVPDVLMAAFGKSVGSQGACVAGSADLRTWLWNRARSFVFSTAPSPLLVSATRSQLRRAQAADAERARLLRVCLEVRTRLAEAGVPLVEGSFGPVVGLLMGAEKRALSLARCLRESGILAQAVRPPTVPVGASRVRLVLRASFSDEQIARLVEVVARETRRTKEG